MADIKGKDESKDSCIMGDFNAPTANLSDIMDNDDDLDLLNVNTLNEPSLYQPIERQPIWTVM